MRPQDHQRLDVVLGEIVRLRAFEIEHAHHASFVNQGDRQLGSRLLINHNITYVTSYVRDANGLAGGNRRANNAFIRRDSHFTQRALAVFYVQAVAEHIGRLIVKQDAQNLIVDDAFHEFRSAAQQFLDIKNRIGLAAHFVQHQKSVGLAADALEQARVLNGDRQAAGHQRQDALLIAGKIINLRALDVEHADRLALNYQGNRQFRPDRVNDVDVSWVFANVRDADGAARRRRCPRDSLPKRD